MGPPATPAGTGGSRQGGGGEPFRVMVVDDSAVVRGLVSRYLQEDPDLRVAASAGNGQRAIEELKRTPVDVVVLDIEMPVMDGLTALPQLLKTQPGVQVVMASTLTRSNADVSLKAMAAGAADYIAKPTASGSLGGQGDYQRELRQKVKALAQAHRRTRGALPASEAPAGPSAPARPASGGTRPPRPAGDEVAVRLRAMPGTRPEAIAIGSSTGGPQALFKFLKGLGPTDAPILITQHMPGTFTALLADHIQRQTGHTCAEARDGEPLAPRRVYVAPGGKHLTVQRQGAGKPTLQLDDGAPENFCKPSVDPMLRSLARIYGGRLLTVILTGMGSDGLRGAEAAVAAGGAVFAQDEATSVVWGMPRAVAKAGLCSAVLPLEELAPAVRKLLVRSAA
jgi:two-component system chemotaxis response regulator CheB